MPPLTAHDFRAWVISCEEDLLQEFVNQIEVDILDFEMEDFFGTEGLNKRFA